MDEVARKLTGANLSSLKRTLLQCEYNDCCPPWKNLTQDEGIQDELRKIYGVKKVALKVGDLLNELTRISLNITYLSIDGQLGSEEREKYYNFFDGVQYYLRLLKVAHELKDGTADGRRYFEDSETRRTLDRQLKSVEFRAAQDPTLSSFIKELLDQDGKVNENFTLYEDFLRFTQFGQSYASNVSFVRESVLVFEQICLHLSSASLQNNFTRPSKQYEIIRRMSYELYLIRNELVQQVSSRVLANRQDVRRALTKLDKLEDSRPYIRMLGDEFSSNPPFFGIHVRRLTRLLDSYLANGLTQVSFYHQLSELPEDFVILGARIAHDYESKELPRYSRFDSDYYSWQTSNHRVSTTAKTNKSALVSTEPRLSNKSILSRLFD